MTELVDRPKEKTTRDVMPFLARATLGCKPIHVEIRTRESGRGNCRSIGAPRPAAQMSQRVRPRRWRAAWRNVAPCRGENTMTEARDAYHHWGAAQRLSPHAASNRSGVGLDAET